MATITHPTGNGYCRDRILRDRAYTQLKWLLSKELNCSVRDQRLVVL